MNDQEAAKQIVETWERNRAEGMLSQSWNKSDLEFDNAVANAQTVAPIDHTERTRLIDAITSLLAQARKESFALGQADQAARDAGLIRQDAYVLLDGAQSDKLDDQGREVLTESAAMLKGIERRILSTSPNPASEFEIRKDQRERDAAIAESAGCSDDSDCSNKVMGREHYSWCPQSVAAAIRANEGGE